jgi:hypothetical protein
LSQLCFVDWFGNKLQLSEKNCFEIKTFFISLGLIFQPMNWFKGTKSQGIFTILPFRDKNGKMYFYL